MIEYLKISGLKTFMVLSLFLTVVSCKSEFEQIRTSGDSEKIYSKAMEYYENGDYSKANTLMELILSTYRGSAEGEDLYFKYAYSSYNQGLYITSANLFETFSSTFPSSKLREEADFMMAYSFYLLSPSFRLDQDYTGKAVDAFQLFVNTFPMSDRVGESNTLIDDLRRKMEEKRMAEAKLYQNLLKYEAAIQVFENLLKDFPESKNAEEIRYMIVESSYQLAANSIYENQKERYVKTNTYADAFLKRYPSSDHLKKVNQFRDFSIQKINEL